MDAIAMKNVVLAYAAALGSILANALGGWDSCMKLLITLMVADYLTGVLLAAVWHKSAKSETGALSSTAGFRGLCKKGVILLVVWVAAQLDRAIGAAYIRTAVVLFFSGNEGLSLLENLGQMGVPYPEVMKRALEALEEKGDSGKEQNDESETVYSDKE